MSGPSLLSIVDVSVRFGGLLALDSVSLSVESEEIVGVIGPNGAGKTTLFNVACGFVAPTSGHLEIGERAVRRLRP
ncbi:MAG: ATP-binding cassette domain-containing protein, partial [Acidimicrobiales bacterium]